MRRFKAWEFLPAREAASRGGCFFFAGVVLAGGIGMLTYVLPLRTGRMLGIFIPGLTLLLVSPLIRILFRLRPVLLDVNGDGMCVDEGRRGTFPFSRATLGAWRGWGVRGTVLHLRAGDIAFRVAGRDHQAGPRRRLEAPVTEDVDAVLKAAEFEALLEALPSSCLPTDVRPGVGESPGERP